MKIGESSDDGGRKKVTGSVSGTDRHRDALPTFRTKNPLTILRTMKLFKLVTETTNNFRQHNLASFASAIAFHTIISLGPLLLFSIGAASIFIGGKEAAGELVNVVEWVVGSDIARLIADVVGQLSEPTARNFLGALIWLGITFYAASNVFRHLVLALDVIWEVEHAPIDKRLGLARRGFIRLREYVVGLVAALVFIIILFISLIAKAGIDSIWQTFATLTPQFANLLSLISYMMIPAILIACSLLAYKFLPNIHIPWRDVWPGAALTGIVLAFAGSIIGYFASRTYVATFYGAAGSVIVLMLWAYFSCYIVLIGAEFTKAYAYTFGSRVTASHLDHELDMGDPHEAEDANL